MAERKNAKHRLVDAWTAGLGGPRTAALLERLDRVAAWETLVAPIAALPEYRGGERGGRPAWPALTMLRCILLAKWFGLSDPQLEECLQDRLSFRRFVGLSLGDSTPDETTFVRFRARLREAGLDREFFERTTAELSRHGLLVRDGSQVDATTIEQSHGSRRADSTSTRDPGASFTKKNGTTRHGYKGHVYADRSALVVDFRFSDAAPHDSRIVPEFVTQGRGPIGMDAGLDGLGQPVTTMKFRFDDGTPYPQTINGQTASDWKLITDPNNPELFQWMPL